MTSLKRSRKIAPTRQVIALALTWDGARWPTKSLPPKVRAFLAGKSRTAFASTARKLAPLLVTDQIKEIRICWVPRLKGGDDVLSKSFSTSTGMRMAFRATKLTRFNDILGVVYRKRFQTRHHK